MPEELTNAQGQLVWNATYKTSGNTVAEEWQRKSLAGQRLHAQEEGDLPAEAGREQNLRFQGQYLDRSTGLHYNTFRYYDADIGRFISPDPIGLWGGHNLHSYAPNPIAWIDPWGLALEHVIFPKEKVLHDVTIKGQGSRDWDFRAANKEAGLNGIRGKPTIASHHDVFGKGETVWHHATYDPVTNEMRMQLVSVEDHNASLPHRGSVADFEATHGVEYESQAEKNKAKQINGAC